MSPIVLVGLWLIAEFASLPPIFGLQAFPAHFELLIHPDASLQATLFHAAGLLLAHWAFILKFGHQRARWATQFLALAVALIKVIVIPAGLDVSTIAGLLLGYTLAIACSPLAPSKWVIPLLTMFVGVLVMSGVSPFEFRSVPSAFNWRPFNAWLQASFLENVHSISQSLFLYAAILGLVSLYGGRVFGSTIALGLLTLVVEGAQVWLEGHTADLSEPLLVIAVGITIRFLQLRPIPNDAAVPIHRSFALPSSTRPDSQSAWPPVIWLLVVVSTCLAIAIALAAALRFPKVPYNVRELFLFDGAFPALWIFALTLIWLGAGAVLLARLLTKSRYPPVTWLVAGLGSSIVCLTLLSASVTQESIGDIAGSTKIFWQVTNKAKWGDMAQALFLSLPIEPLFSFIERIVRFAALYIPPIGMLAYFWWIATSAADRMLLPKRAAIIAASAVPTFWLAKAIAFDWSSTDNLNELIAADGRWGLGGGGYLYALMALICAEAVALQRTHWRSLSAIGGTAMLFAAASVGWWLLNLGLEQHVQKYGFDFSGAQFLLGPDRANKIAPNILFIRWITVQSSIAVVLCIGLTFAARFPPLPWRRSGTHRIIEAVNDERAMKNNQTQNIAS